MTEQSSGDIIALDVGTVRIGVARASAIVRLAQPLTTLTHDATIWDTLEDILQQHQAQSIVVGLPRGLDGQETAQTTAVRQFVDELATHTALPIVFQDEALTSHKAEAELESRKKPYAKGEVDALAATYILDDYLTGMVN